MRAHLWRVALSAIVHESFDFAAFDRYLEQVDCDRVHEFEYLEAAFEFLKQSCAPN